MRYTLIEMVQRILDAMESDEVSDIGETPESRTVVGVIKQNYFDIIGRFGMDETNGLFKLDASIDDTKPCLMTIPEGVSKISWLKYNIGEVSDPEWRTLTFRTVEEYLSCQPNDDNYETMTVSIDGNLVVTRLRNDRHPTYYTILGNYTVLFDAYDSSLEDTLTQARSLGFGELVPSFQEDNLWVPNINPKQFQLLLNQSMSQAFIELKQAANPVSDMKSRKNHILTQKNKSDNDPAWSNQKHVGYGRKGGGRTQMQRAMRNGI